MTVNADSRPPVAVRITRPYASEDEYLDHDLDTLTRTSITLVGAQQRPEGVVLRFEVVLSEGHLLLRGEGRVVGYKPDVYDGLGGLLLRFTRLDMRSKALVDRAATLRERRRPAGQSQAPPFDDAPPTDSAPRHDDSAPSSRASLRPGAGGASRLPPEPTSSGSVVGAMPSRETLRLPPAPLMSSLTAPSFDDGSSPQLELPPSAPKLPGLATAIDREALLARLRARRHALDQAAIDGLIARRGRRPQ